MKAYTQKKKNFCKDTPSWESYTGTIDASTTRAAAFKNESILGMRSKVQHLSNIIYSSITMYHGKTLLK